MKNKYSLKEAFKIWMSCHTVKKKRITRNELFIFSMAFYISLPMFILLWWIPVRNIMKKGVKNKKNYSYFEK